ncbi:MAG: hydrolase [Rickettsia endosymbiont of Ixodes persulcatus]|nr:hydrolase [Rickettsia endosymbiont of Ixodes persulcatus]
MIQKSLFKPSWWMTNAHLQTIWQTFFRRQPEVSTQRERLLLPDGDFVDLDWAGYEEDAPIVLVLHGIAGSVESPYAKGMLRAIVDHGWCGIFMHFRGCSGEPNKLPRGYHSGETTDLASVVSELQERYPGKPIAAIGFSMGGNVLLKWLGETGAKNPLAAAVAVSVPFELEKAANHINKGLFRLYQWWLLRDLREVLIKKFKKIKPPVGMGDLSKINSFWDLDNKITAPLHGFTDAHDYYHKASSRQFLKQIEVPTLILHSSDDPFMEKNAIAEASELSPKLTLELSDFGGHVGFVAGTPWKPTYWLEERIPQFLSEIFKK